MDEEENHLTDTQISETHTNNILLTESETEKMVKPESDNESFITPKRETVILHTSNVTQFGVGRVEPEKEKNPQKEQLSDKKDRKEKVRNHPYLKKRKLLLYTLLMFHRLKQEGLNRKRIGKEKMKNLRKLNLKF